MVMKLIVLILLLHLCMTSLCQQTPKSNLELYFYDSLSYKPISGISVVLKIQDTPILNAISNAKGIVSFQSIPKAKSISFIATHKSYTTLHWKLDITQQERVGVLRDTLLLVPLFESMDSVVVSASRSFYRNKVDTVEYDANFMALNENASLKELLTLIPGLSIENDGSLTYNGKRIPIIKINGKDYFGNDPNLISKLISARLVSKIQLTPIKTFGERFNKSLSLSDDRELNIILKDDATNALLGQIKSAYGTLNRYQQFLSLNYFNSIMQGGIIANFNNIGNESASVNDELDKQINSTGIPGVSSFKYFGATISAKPSNRISFSGNIFQNYTSQRNNSSLLRNEISANMERLYKSVDESTLKSKNNHTEFKSEYQPDSNSALSISYINSYNETSILTQQNASSLNGRNQIINSSSSHNIDSSIQRNNAIDLFLGQTMFKRFKINLSLTRLTSESKSLKYVQSQNTTLAENGSSVDTMINQKRDVFQRNNIVGATVTLLHQLNSRKQLQVTLGYSTNKNTLSWMSYRYDSLNQSYTTLDTSMNTANNTKLSSIVLGSGYTFSSMNLSFFIGAALESSNQTVTNSAFKSTFRRYQFIKPEFMLTYRLGKSKSFLVQYDQSIMFPHITQLVPLPDFQNYLYVNIGNPMLQPSVDRKLSLTFTNMYGQKMWTFGGDISLYENKVVDEMWFEQIQFSRPVNSDGNFSYKLFLIHNRIRKKLKSSKSITWKMEITSDHYKTYNNKLPANANNLSFSNTLGYYLNINNKFSLIPSYRLIATRSLLKGLYQTEFSFLNHRLQIATFNTLSKIIDIKNSLELDIRDGSKIVGNKLLFWNSELSFNGLKKIILKITGRNILNSQSQADTRFSTSHFEIIKNSTLQQFFLMTVLLNLSKS